MPLLMTTTAFRFGRRWSRVQVFLNGVSCTISAMWCLEDIHRVNQSHAYTLLKQRVVVTCLHNRTIVYHVQSSKDAFNSIILFFFVKMPAASDVLWLKQTVFQPSSPEYSTSRNFHQLTHPFEGLCEPAGTFVALKLSHVTLTCKVLAHNQP